MKTLNLTLVAFAVVSTLGSAAFAQDGVSVATQGATASYDSINALAVAPAAVAQFGADGYSIQHNRLGNR